MSSYLRVKLIGGLGNQLFQFACGYAYAQKNGLPLFIDDTSYQRRASGTPRVFELEPYDIRPGWFNFSSLSSGDRPKPIRVRQGPGSVWRSFSRLAEFRVTEESLAFVPPNQRSNQRKLALEGYFQSETYFQEFKDDIRGLFEAPAVSRETRAWAKRIKESEDHICIQVRRGDYVTDSKTAKFHGLTQREHFIRAIEKFQETEMVKGVFVFSDDPDWCEANIDLGVPATTVRISGAEHDAVSNLFALSRGKRFAISNSSFGWWGAWLSGQPGTSIAAPSRWFASPTMTDVTPVPDTWLRI